MCTGGKVVAVRSLWPNLRRFARRVQARLWLVRLLEAGGLGVGFGAMAGLCLLWWAEAVMTVVGGSSGMGLLAGVIWAVLRRPKVMQALGEADRQLGLEDLLTTAWVLYKRNSGGDLEKAVLVMAEEKAAEVTASQVILGRFGRRGWGGIGLATALAITVGLISANPVDTRAAGGGLAVVSGESIPQRDHAASRQAGSGGRALAGDFGPDQYGERVVDPAGNLVDTPSKGGAGDSRLASESANPNGSGGGSARSNPTRGGDSITPQATGSVGAGKGESAGGVGAGNGTSDGTRGASGRSAGGAVAARPAPPWRGAGWDSARGAADHAVRNGQVPAEYVDLVREYFEGER